MKKNIVHITVRMNLIYSKLVFLKKKTVNKINTMKKKLFT